MKSILLHVNDTEGCEGRLQATFDIARAFDAHVTMLHAVSYEIFAPGDIYGSAVAAALPQIREQAAAFRARMEADLANEDVAWEWVLRHGLPEHALLEYSPLSDLLVVGPRDAGEADTRASAMVGTLLVKARSPVLVMPEGQTAFDAEAPAFVAWNGSSEAALALRAAVPMLKKARSVSLVSVSEEKDRERFDFPPVRGAEYLSRHGIECELVDIPHGEGSVADTLFHAAEARKCGLMVMGAYGHSRLAEMLLGGVTRRAVTNPAIPILLAH
ncbi:universal stress protein [Altererythrobacter sp. GH1-8]|uniref:universal stress protein n=1 Tax=Altererythrobacter sp. GH1-8 TaxID=3349333 RepID=UPI00374C9EEE